MAKKTIRRKGKATVQYIRKDEGDIIDKKTTVGFTRAVSKAVDEMRLRKDPTLSYQEFVRALIVGCLESDRMERLAMRHDPKKSVEQNIKEINEDQGTVEEVKKLVYQGNGVACSVCGKETKDVGKRYSYPPKVATVCPHCGHTHFRWDNSGDAFGDLTKPKEEATTP